MKLDVEVPEDVMRKALTDIAARLFASADQYGVKAGEGYRALASQVGDWIAQQDFTAVIQAEARRQMQSVVADVVRAKLQAEIKRQAMELVRQGRLIPDSLDTSGA